MQCRDPIQWLHTQEMGEQGLCTQFPFSVADLQAAPEEAEGLEGLVVELMWDPHLWSSWMVTPGYFVGLTFSRMCPWSSYAGMIF